MAYFYLGVSPGSLLGGSYTEQESVEIVSKFSKMLPWQEVVTG